VCVCVCVCVYWELNPHLFCVCVMVRVVLEFELRTLCLLDKRSTQPFFALVIFQEGAYVIAHSPVAGITLQI
jgi:hypothetical protein